MVFTITHICIVAQPVLRLDVSSLTEIQYLQIAHLLNLFKTRCVFINRNSVFAY